MLHRRGCSTGSPHRSPVMVMIIVVMVVIAAPAAVMAVWARMVAAVVTELDVSWCRRVDHRCRLINHWRRCVHDRRAVDGSTATKEEADIHPSLCNARRRNQQQRRGDAPQNPLRHFSNLHAGPPLLAARPVTPSLPVAERLGREASKWKPKGRDLGIPRLCLKLDSSPEGSTSKETPSMRCRQHVVLPVLYQPYGP